MLIVVCYFKVKIYFDWVIVNEKIIESGESFVGFIGVVESDVGEIMVDIFGVVGDFDFFDLINSLLEVFLLWEIWWLVLSKM